jgi:hypothetical protein
MAAAGGLATIGRPMVDRGVDLYMRRLRSLLTVPIQVKGFTQPGGGPPGPALGDISGPAWNES